MPLPLLEHLPYLRSQIVAAPHLLIMLDFDGTLAPIVDRPGDARLPQATRATLSALTQRPNTTVAIVSGRSIEDVLPRIGIDDLIYAGNHGLEIQTRDNYFLRSAPGDSQRKLQELAGQLTTSLARFTGVLVEDKRLTLSVHYRLLAENRWDDFRDTINRELADVHSHFQVTTGHMVYEIRPRVDWNKGNATNWILNHLGVASALPIYLGDDRTDEDAFRVLTDGITVRVGDVSDTIARYYVSGPDAACAFLRWLTEECCPINQANA